MLALPLLAAVALAGNPVALTGADNGRSLRVAPATPIVLTLPSNASTGYRWHILAPLDKAVLRLVAHSYRPSASTLIGAAGTEIWRFQAVGKGKLTVRLGYFRSFAPTQVARRFRVDFRVS